MIVYPPKTRTTYAADRKRLIHLEKRRNRTLYREPPPERVAPPITLPPVTMSTLTDDEADRAVGLAPDGGVSQRKAETYIKAVIGHRLREAEKVGFTAPAAPALHVEVDETALHIAHVVDRDIAVQLARLTARSPARWMSADPATWAS